MISRYLALGCVFVAVALPAAAADATDRAARPWHASLKIYGLSMLLQMRRARQA